MSVFLHLKIYLLHCFKLSQVKYSIFSDEWIAFHFIYFLNIRLMHSDKFYLFIFVFIFYFFPFIFISWRLITLQYYSGFCHTWTWISHGFTCVPLPDPPSRLLAHPIPLGLPSAPALSTCLMHPTWAGDLFHPW